MEQEAKERRQDDKQLVDTMKQMDGTEMAMEVDVPATDKEDLKQPPKESQMTSKGIESHEDPNDDDDDEDDGAAVELTDEAAVLLTTSDKAVCTNDTLEDLQRALTYEAVFSTLIEKKMLAMKRDCEERKRAKRMKRKSIGRMFFSKKFFGTPKSGAPAVGSAKAVDEGIPDVGKQTETSHVVAAASARLPHAEKSTKTAKKVGGGGTSLVRGTSARAADDIEVASAGSSESQKQQQQQQQQRAAKSHMRSKPKAIASTANTNTNNTTTSASSTTVEPRQSSPANADDSITSTLSNNSSDKMVVHQHHPTSASMRRNLLVRAQTHTPAEVATTSSSSGESRDAAASSTRRSAGTSCTINGNSITAAAALPTSLLCDQTQTYDTASMASGYDNGIGARGLHTSTMADDSLTSMRDSIESLSFASSRCTVSFGGTEIIPEDTASLLYERARAAVRLRILEAKSISAQCSPIFPRHSIRMIPGVPMSPLAAQPTLPPSSLASTHTAAMSPSFVPAMSSSPAANVATIPLSITSDAASAGKTSSMPAPSKPRLLTNQVSYTESMNGGCGSELAFGGVAGVAGGAADTAEAAAAYARYFSRQNTSEDSANLTVSTLLNQSDSLSLHAPVYSSTAVATGAIPFSLLGDRHKSKSTSLLVCSSSSTARPIPTSLLPSSPANGALLPLEQLEQLRIASNISHSERLVDNITQIKTQKHIPESLAIASGGAALSSSSAPSIACTVAASLTTASGSVNAAPIVAAATVTTEAALPLFSAFRNGGGGGTGVNGAIVPTSAMPGDTAKLHRMTSTSTGSSVAPTGLCCTTTKSSSRDREKQRFKPNLPTGQSGSDDEYRRRKRKYKRYHRCSDPVLVYPTPSGLQHCILSVPPNDPVQFPYNEDYAYDMQLQIESDKNDDLEEIVPSSNRRHRRHRHHRHKKRHRHKKPKILVQDLESQVVKVIDPDDLPQRARWTIIATACLLLLMCLMLVGITLRMAPIIDDMGSVRGMQRKELDDKNSTPASQN